ncbi:MAG: transposase [Gammaproteobacteria bacterium]
MSAQPPARHRSNRLRTYDYRTAGAYFVTICASNRRFMFGAVADAQMTLNQTGTVVQRVWFDSERIRPGITLDEFIVMPNHIHSIVLLPNLGSKRAHGCAPLRKRLARAPRSLGSFIAGFNSTSTREVNRLLGRAGRLWQRNYYEHVVRHERDLERIRQYIREDPTRWEFDRENPNAPATTKVRAPWEP